MNKTIHQLETALRDCVHVMERDLNGLAVIQPELAQAKKALAELYVMGADFIEWNGQGLPPVGTVCEYYADEDEWRRCEIVAHKDGYVVVWVNHAHIWSAKGSGFRPLRTPEQISAEDREAAIDKMRRAAVDCGFVPHYGFLSMLYDAGYRKQEQPK